MAPKTYFDAIRQFNKERPGRKQGNPKKDSPEYKRVMEILEEMNRGETPAPTTAEVRAKIFENLPPKVQKRKTLLSDAAKRYGEKRKLSDAILRGEEGAKERLVELEKVQETRRREVKERKKAEAAARKAALVEEKKKKKEEQEAEKKRKEEEKRMKEEEEAKKTGEMKRLEKLVKKNADRQAKKDAAGGVIEAEKSQYQKAVEGGLLEKNKEKRRIAAEQKAMMKADKETQEETEKRLKRQVQGREYNRKKKESIK